MPNCSAEKLAAWVKTCFDDSLISQVCPIQSRDICCSRSLDFHIRFQVREKAIPMFEEMGGREGLVHFLDTSLESGLPSAEVMTKNHVLLSFDIAWLFLSRHYGHDYILLAYLLENDLRIRCGCFNQNHCNGAPSFAKSSTPVQSNLVQVRCRRDRFGSNHVDPEPQESIW
jgi:hypothetical protein